jgi:hypothetical protein
MLRDILVDLIIYVYILARTRAGYVNYITTTWIRIGYRIYSL